jgi:glutathione S-transferase
LPEATPILWHFPVSHFNEKARWALDWKGIRHVRRPLFLDYIPRAWLRTRQLSLPILILGDEAVSDSTRIISVLEERWPDPALYFTDPELQRRALELEDFFDEAVGGPLRTLVVGELWRQDPGKAIQLLATGQPDAPVGIARAIARGMRALYRSRHGINQETQALAPGQVEAGLARLERSIGPSGFLVGDRFSVADLTAAAILAPLVRPPGHEYPVDEALLPDSARAYRAEHEHREAFAWVRQTYDRHRGASMELLPDGG